MITADIQFGALNEIQFNCPAMNVPDGDPYQVAHNMISPYPGTLHLNVSLCPAMIQNVSNIHKNNPARLQRNRCDYEAIIS